MDDSYSYVYGRLDNYFSDYGLDGKLLDRYTKQVISWGNSSKYKNYDYQIERIVGVFHICEDYFKDQGYDEERSIEAAKHLTLLYRSKSFITTLNLIKSMGMLDQSIDYQFNIFRTSCEVVHARYKYLLLTGFEGHMYNAITDGERNFQTRFHVSTESLKRMYPYTDDVKKIQNYLAKKSDAEIEKELGVTRTQLSKIYPDNKKTIIALKRISRFSDHAVKSMFGVDRETILSKPGLDYDTLVALNQIQLTANSKIEELLGIKKEIALSESQLWSERAKQLVKKEEN